MTFNPPSPIPHPPSKSSPQLFIVSTPIGNLEDMGFRAIKVLQEVDFVICEDTRRSRILFDNYEIKPKKIMSFHVRSSEQKIKKIIDLMKSGNSAALITDAGTPGISDPGFLITREARINKIKISPIPGPSAFLAALSASGFPTDKFVFYGFLPQKKGKNKIFLEIKNLDKTTCFYESPTRIVKTLKKMAEIIPERKICLAREITKIYEEFIYGYPGELLEDFENKKIKGEFVVIVAPGNLREVDPTK